MFVFYISVAPSMVSLFWCVYFLINRKRNTIPQNIMILITFVLILLFFNHLYCAYNLNSYLLFPDSDVINTLLTLSLPSLLFLFIKTMTCGKIRFFDFISFIPALIFGTIVSILYMAMNENEFKYYSLHILKNREALSVNTSGILNVQYILAERVYFIVLLSLFAFVLYFAFTQTKSYHKRLQNFYSCPDTMEIEIKTRINQILIPFFALLLTFTFFISSTYFKEYHFILVIIYIGETILVYSLCYYASLIRHTAFDFYQDIIKSDEINNQISSDQKDLLNPYKVSVKHFESMMATQRIYLQPHLRIDEVARLMATNRSYLSEMINKEYKMSFSTYINTLRIRYAKRLMLSDRSLTQDKIAEHSGYLNASSFNRSFKTLTGLTPKSWLEEQT